MTPTIPQPDARARRRSCAWRSEVARLLALVSPALALAGAILWAGGRAAPPAGGPASAMAFLPLLAVPRAVSSKGRSGATSLVVAAGLFLAATAGEWQGAPAGVAGMAYGAAVLVTALVLGAGWGVGAAALAAATHVLLGGPLPEGAIFGLALAAIALLGGRAARRAAEEGRRAEDLRAAVGERTADVVALRQALEEARAAQNDLRRALDEQEVRCRSLSALNGAWAYGVRLLPGGTVRMEWLTAPFSRMTGYRQEDVAASREGWLGLVREEDRPAVSDSLATITRTGEPQRIEYRITTRTGEVRWIRDHAEPLWDAAERRVIGVRGAAQDVTEEKRSQEEHLAAERLAVVESMVASLSHEINNPLQTVLGCLGLVHEALPEDEMLREYVRISTQELRRASDIVRRLRETCAPLDAGLRRHTDVNDLVREAVEACAFTLRHANVETCLDLATPSALVGIVRDRLRQVFLNLVGECLRAMPEGGTLRISTAPVASPEGVEVRFLSESPHPRQGREAGPGPHPGAPGLSRAVTRHIVEQHGGRMAHEEGTDGASIVTVWLPAAPDRVAE